MNTRTLHWPWASDVTWGTVWLIGGALFFMAALCVPA
jgi:hypothetical protein